MSEKIAFGIVAAVLAVSIIGVVQFNDETTGAALLERAQCCCELTRYDFYGQAIGTEVHPVRPKSRATLTEAGCEVQCDRMFTHKYTDVTGSPC